jgi:DHA1 family inner membrane transport protein
VPQKRAQAIALMIAGLTLANVLGVPSGTALGNALGWRRLADETTLISMASITWRCPSARASRPSATCGAAKALAYRT